MTTPTLRTTSNKDKTTNTTTTTTTTNEQAKKVMVRKNSTWSAAGVSLRSDTGSDLQSEMFGY